MERTISVAYYALIDIEKHNKELVQHNYAQWFKLDETPQLIFNHGQMVKKAIGRLRRRAINKPIGFELLPEKFTM